MKKFLLSIILSLILVFSFIIPAAAADFSAYQNVNDSTSSVNILMDAYMNSEDFSYSDDFIIFSDSQNSYYLVYGDIDSATLSGKDLKYFRYYTTNAGGYNYNWILQTGSFSDVFRFDNSNFTYVSSEGLGGLQHLDFENSYDVYIITALVVVFVILFIFSIFRSFVGGGYN